MGNLSFGFRCKLGGERMKRVPPLVAEVLQGKSFLWEGDFDEKPVDRVRITKPFCMGVVEVDRREIKHLGI
jgi:hypothetical protein